jgi:hypothetical protein
VRDAEAFRQQPVLERHHVGIAVAGEPLPQSSLGLLDFPCPTASGMTTKCVAASRGCPGPNISVANCG